MENGKDKKTENGLVKFVKGIFVNNIVLKVFSILFAALVGVIIMGLTPIA